MDLQAVLADSFDTAAKITTPLALAALFLLVAGGVMKVLTPKGRHASAERKTLFRYGFILALVLSLSANAIYLIKAGYNREVRISGTVRGENGHGLGRAIVDIPGKGRGITDDYGSFQFPVPDVYADDGYEAYVTLDGFKPAKVALPGRAPRPANIILASLKAADEVRVTAGDEIVVKHLLGVPVVDLLVDTSNGLPSLVNVGQFSVELQSETGRKVSLPVQGMSPGQNFPFSPALPYLILQPQQKLQWCFEFSYQDPAINNLGDRVNRQFMVPLGTMQNPDTTKKVYTDDLTQELRSYLASHFLWEPGRWKLVFYYVLDGKKIGYTRHFTLDPATVTSMKNIGNYYQSGVGVVGMWSYVNGLDFNPAARVTLED